MSNKDPGFATTRWSVVLSAGKERSEQSREALTLLCETYWYPVYAFLRRTGLSPDDASDSAQEFFSHLIERPDLYRPDPGKGRFRSYLLGCVKHFVSKERAAAAAKKRGGDRRVFSLDGDGAERRYLLQGKGGEDPEREFARTWALTVLEGVVLRLRTEYEEKGREALFEKLRGALMDPDIQASYQEIGEELGLSEGAVKTAAHRLRGRFSELLRATVRETLQQPDTGAIEEELRDLFRALAR